MLKKILFLFIGMLIINSCTPLYNKKYLIKGDYPKITNHIETNGYYYRQYEKDGGITMLVLLNNGIAHIPNTGYGINDCGSPVDLECDIRIKEEQLVKFSNMKIDTDKQSNANIFLWNWGKYEIKNDTITIQWFYNIHGRLFLAEEKGKIINSKSIHFFNSKSYYSKKSQSGKSINNLYEFKPFDISVLYKKIPKRLIDKK
ncbi:hypothetical protein ACTS91_05280 [Empedobacter falsenii]|uniref:Uncharacterized protein n=1 Tax=Empedobacter falsenii TaxID=343874 RepID=A0A376FZA8_9FLAO|nr:MULTISPECIES: hypothetical protein [Empedobacter]STD53011.1 Uncharacterised protein [Empedobacter falsenii]